MAGVELGESRAGGSQLVEVRRLNPRMTVTAKVAVTEVIGENEDDVGPGIRRHRAEPCAGNRREEAQPLGVLPGTAPATCVHRAHLKTALAAK